MRTKWVTNSAISSASNSATNSGRAEVLRRIREAIGVTPDRAAVEVGWEGIAREYRRKGMRGREEVMRLLEDRLRDYDARVVRASSESVAQSVAQSVAKMLVERGVRRMVVPGGLPVAWLPGSTDADGVEFVIDEGLSAVELDGVDGVMTGATLAIAETGNGGSAECEGAGKADGKRWFRTITFVW